jgi:uncharacterized protein YbaR (Trm112 family)
MTITPELLKILVCPDCHRPLELASRDLIECVNRAIAQGQLCNKAGARLEKRLDGGLVRDDQAVLYPIMDDIPMLLVDEGIPLDQLRT